ncbi:protein CEPU-1-like [Sinocyclocheilus grahami]|uniref:protein CEPU-1-like n=1 Tax=Sinocyclocheilus grahami TaxID=75366 RepID=UPI0007AD694E|nr:PREDICTED: protein CEPU-1-like [Sinocyclocheilus grahami]
MSKCLLHSYLEPGTTLPLIPPDFQIGICKKENNHADLTRTRFASDAMQNPVYWVVLAGISIALIQQGLPVRSQGESQSDSKQMDNITIRQGETLFLSCSQGDFVTHTAWLNKTKCNIAHKLYRPLLWCAFVTFRA